MRRAGPVHLRESRAGPDAGLRQRRGAAGEEHRARCLRRSRGARPAVCALPPQGRGRRRARAVEDQAGPRAHRPALLAGRRGSRGHVPRHLGARHHRRRDHQPRAPQAARDAGDHGDDARHGRPPDAGGVLGRRPRSPDLPVRRRGSRSVRHPSGTIPRHDARAGPPHRPGIARSGRHAPPRADRRDRDLRQRVAPEAPGHHGVSAPQQRRDRRRDRDLRRHDHAVHAGSPTTSTTCWSRSSATPTSRCARSGRAGRVAVRWRTSSRRGCAAPS